MAFAANSRYAKLAVLTLAASDRAAPIQYVARRFIPPPAAFALLTEHVVTAGERLDQIAARYIGDPERFWQICDANGAMRPEDLTDAPGQTLRITLPAGIAGGPGA